MKAFTTLVVSLISFLAFAWETYSQVPQMLHFQGSITEHRSKFDGLGQFRFSLVNSNGSRTFWSNDGTGVGGAAPSNSVPIPVNKGSFAVTLGDVALPNMTPISPTIFTNEDVRLRIWFQEGKQGLQLLSPDQRILAVGYAMVAATIPDQTVTTEKLAMNAVTSDIIAPGAVRTPHLASGAVTADKLAPGAIGPELLPPGSITTSKLADGSVTAPKIANQAVTSSQLSARSVGSNHVVAGSIHSIHVADGAIGTPQIANASITSAKIAAQAVSASHLAPNAAVQNLNAGGFGAVPASGMIFSFENNAFTLLSAGYTQAGTIDMVPETWEPRAPLGSSLDEHTDVWTGSEMIVWGGATLQVPTGGRYNPTTDAWQAVAVTGAPTPRWNHVAVWTGREMLLWGGMGTSSRELNDGGRYDPASNTWRPITTLGAPARRYGMTAVWAEALGAMIVWGGASGGGSSLIIYGDGGLYDPDRDEWMALPANAAVPARYNHTAVWTGQEMIVWGGQVSSGPIAAGARFNPFIPQWTLLSPINSPAPRFEHTVIWTGQEMIVWGGRQGGSIGLRSGGRFDPASGTWLPTSTMLAPSARWEHSAVWTGEEMVVWGGLDDEGGGIMTGGRYNPETDQWSTMTDDGGPSSAGHSGVWTGEGMVIFGGGGASRLDSNHFWRPAKKLYLYQR